MNWAKYSIENQSLGKSKVTRISYSKLLFEYPCSSTKCTNYIVTVLPGLYRFECYGAGRATGTAGAYTAGTLKLEKSKTFYFYIGNKPTSDVYFDEVFNSGIGKVQFAGSGSTDIRLESGIWHSFDSLKTRIMVAAGSGASECGTGGSGGDIVGFDGKGGPCEGVQYNAYGYGANQNRTNSNFESFGISHNVSSAMNINSGGNGYYAGGPSRDIGAGAGGGSSFISGHKGCDAILESSTKDKIVHSGSPNHFTNVIFYNTVMKNGNEKMLDPKGNIIEGNVGNGKIVLTKLDFKYSCKGYHRSSFSFSYVFILHMTC